MICENIHARRIALKLTQEDLAAKIGVARQTVAKWESGEAIPDLTNASNLASVLDITLDDLVNHNQQQSGHPAPPRGKHIFGVVRLGERGQIVIPKKAREVFGLAAGSELLMLGDESQGIALVPVDDAVEAFDTFQKIIAEGAVDGND